MGQGESKKKIEEEFQIYRMEIDGNALLKSRKDGKQYMMRLITCSSQNDIDRLKALLECRAQLRSHHLLSLVEIKQKKQDMVCSVHYRMYLVLQYSFKSLQQEMQERNSADSPFQQSDLWSIMYSCCCALNTLYASGATHQCLTSKQMFINRDGFVKIAQPLLFGLEKNHIEAMQGSEDKPLSVHLSPQIMGCLDDQNFFYYDKEKSDVFTLGMIMMDLALLTDNYLFDTKHRKPRLQIIPKLLGKVAEQYSPSFVDLLGEMLRVQAKQRPNLPAIIEKIEKCNNILDQYTLQTEYQPKSKQLPPPQVPVYSRPPPDPPSHKVAPAGPATHVITESISASAHQRPNTQSLSIKQQNSNSFNQMTFSGRVFNYTPQTSHVQPPQTQGSSYYQPPSQFNSSYQTPTLGATLTRPDNHYQFGYSMGTRQDGFSTSDRVKEITTTYTKNEGIFSQLQAKPLTTTSPPIPTTQYTSSPLPQTSSHYTSNPPRSSKPLFTHQIPQIYNLLVKSHKKEETKLFSETQHVPTPPITSNIPAVSTTKSRFSQLHNYHETVSRPSEQVDSPSIPLHKNISKAESELVKRPQPPAEEFRHQTPTKPPFSSSIAEKSSFHKSSSAAAVPTQPLVSASFLPEAPITSPVRRSSYSSSQARRSRHSEQKLEFVKEEIPERGMYEGYKADGQRNGHGTLHFSDGGKYQGEWKDDKMHGFGKLFYQNGKTAYEGHWQKDEFNGQGRVYNAEPQQLSESFNYKDFSELGNQWLYYQGQFKSDSKHGKGYIKLTNGQMYEGIFQHDMIQGNGIFYKSNGQIVIGFWIDNKLFLNQSYEHQPK